MTWRARRGTRLLGIRRLGGLNIDWCRGHGYWFDTHELELIVAFIAKGGLEKFRRREIETQKQNLKHAQSRARSTARLKGRGSAGLGGPHGLGGGYGGVNLIDALVNLVGGLLR